MKNQPWRDLVRILIDLIDARGVEGRRTTDDAVDLVAFSDEELGEIRAVLAGDPCDQGLLHFCSRHHWMVLWRPSSKPVAAVQPSFSFARETSSARRGWPF